MEPHQGQQHQLEYRLATQADKEQVLRCHGDEPGTIYDGLDYVPRRYEAALASWNKVCGLCIDKSVGMVVAYGQIFVFDNKRHMLLTALRVHPQYQSRGIATHLRNFLCQETRKIFPDVTPEVRFGVYKPEFSTADFYARNPDYQLISKRHYYLMYFPLSRPAELHREVSAAAAAAVAAADPQSGAAPQTLWTDRRRAFSAMLGDAPFRRIHGGGAVSINFEVLELMEENLDILPGDAGDTASSCVIVAKGDRMTVAFGCSLRCLKGLRADIDLYNNEVDRADFSPESLSVTCAALVLQFLDRLLTSESESVAQMPTKSLSVFVSFDCFNRGGFDCRDCDLETRLAARLRGLISEDISPRHAFYSQGCPYTILKRRVPI